MSKVYLGVGHGNTDSGAVGNGLKEKEIALDVAKYVFDDLNRNGVNCKISRKDDSKVWLEERIAQCNAYNPDLALDIHFNAGGGDGAEVYHTINGGTGKTLAENILSELVKIGQNSRGTKTRKNANGQDYFGFIRQTRCPAVLVECAFIDNKKDISIADTTAERKKIGVAISKAIIKTLGLKYKAEEEKKTSNKIYRVQVGAYTDKSNAEYLLKKLNQAGFDGFIVEGTK